MSVQAFLETRSAMAAGFSPDGKRLLVASNLTGTYQLYYTPVSGGELVPITRFEEPVSGRYLPGHPGTLLISMDEGGNERDQIYLIEDDGSNLREVVHEPEFIFRLGGVTREGTRIAYASNRRNGVDFDVWVHDLASGERRLVFAPGGWCDAARFSPDGRYLGVVRLSERSGDNDLYVVDLEAGDEAIHVSPHGDESQHSGPVWLADGSGFYFTTDQGRDVAGLALYDLRARAWRYVRDYEWEPSCHGDAAGRHLLVATNRDGASRFELFDSRTLTSLGEVPVPGAGVGHGQFRMLDPVFSVDGEQLAFTWTSGARIPEAWVYDVGTRALRRATHSPTAIPHDALVEPEAHRIRSFDGLEFSVQLFRPRPGQVAAPVVVVVHGGPEGQYKPVFDPLVAYLVHTGYAVVAPNVRGSTGYGKRFQHLDDVRLRLDSVRDLAALHDWLPFVGLDPRRAALFGGSYGGFMVLAGLAFQPERWAAGVDIVGISSWVTFLENTSAWRRKFREREYGSLEKDRDFLEAASPITHVDRMRAPLFIIHGVNDPRVPVGEARAIHRALVERNIPSEMVIYEDEGHGLMKLANRLDAYPRVVAFLDRVLRSGGSSER